MRTKTVPSVRHAFGIAAIGTLAALGSADRAIAQQQVANVQQDRAAHLAAKCDHIKDHAEAAGCYTRESIRFDQARGIAADQRAAAADRRAAEADKRAAAADRRGTKADEDIKAISVLQECGNFLRDNRGKTFTHEKMIELAGGKITNDNICSVAKRLGHVPPKASLGTPTVR
jgi:hypothetical protein